MDSNLTDDDVEEMTDSMCEQLQELHVGLNVHIESTESLRYLVERKVANAMPSLSILDVRKTGLDPYDIAWLREDAMKSGLFITQTDKEVQDARLQKNQSQ